MAKQQNEHDETLSEIQDLSDYIVPVATELINVQKTKRWSKEPASRAEALKHSDNMHGLLEAMSELEEEIESAAGRLQALEKQRDSLLRGRKRKAMLKSI